eukprot:scaffold4240_cov163-Amphora_coffeaeformis.AAC.10
MTSAEEFSKTVELLSREDPKEFERSVSSGRSNSCSTTQRLSTVEIRKLRNLTQKALPIKEDTTGDKKDLTANVSARHQTLGLAQVPVKASIGEPLQFVASTAATGTGTATAREFTNLNGETIQGEIKGEPGEKRAFQKTKWRQIVSRYKKQRSILVVNEQCRKSLIPLESRIRSTTPKELPSLHNNQSTKDNLIRRPFLETDNELLSLASGPQTSVLDEEEQQHQRTRLHPLFQLCKLQVWYTTKSPLKRQSLSTIPSVIEYYKEPTAAEVYENDYDDSSRASIPCPMEISVEQSDVQQAERKSSFSLAYFVNKILYPVVLAIFFYKAIFRWTEGAEPTGTASKAVVLSEQNYHFLVKQSKALVTRPSLGLFSPRDAILRSNYLRILSTREIPSLELIHHQESSLVDAIHFELLPPPPLLLPGRVEPDAQEVKIPIDTIIIEWKNPSFEWHVANRPLGAPGNIRKLEQILNNNCFACEDSRPHQPLTSSLSKVLILRSGEYPWSQALDGFFCRLGKRGEHTYSSEDDAADLSGQYFTCGSVSKVSLQNRRSSGDEWMVRLRWMISWRSKKRLLPKQRVLKLTKPVNRNRAHLARVRQCTETAKVPLRSGNPGEDQGGIPFSNVKGDE